MRKQVRRRHEAQARVQGVCAEYSALFDAGPGGRKARAAVAADVAEVDSRALLERVSAHADAFVAEGLPPDLLKQLDDDIVAFAAARDAQTVARQRFSSATDRAASAKVPGVYAPPVSS